MKPRPRPSPTVRPAVELLEPRTAPAVFSVDSQASLAAAITTANRNRQPDTIRIVRDITLTGKPLPALAADAGQRVILHGDGHVLRRVGNIPFRVLENNGARLAIDRLTVSGGVATAEGGGGIFNHAGRLSLQLVHVIGNRAAGKSVGAGIFNHAGAVLSIDTSVLAGNHSATFGGGMRNQGHVLFIDRSTFANNSAATDGGGGICNFFGGVIDVVRNSTITGNHAVRGGAVCNHGIISLINCTLVGNSAVATGGGIENDHRVPVLINCIVAHNRHGNLYPNAPEFSWNNLIGGDPRVSARLRDNGGPTPTLALLPHSPALGLGTRFRAPSIDQRGVRRPPDSIDIGAYQQST